MLVGQLRERNLATLNALDFCLDNSSFSPLKLKTLTLPKKLQRVVVHHFPNQRLVVAAPAHFQDEIGHGRRFAGAPVAGGVDHQPLGTVAFDHVRSAGRGAFADGVERHAGPKASLKDGADGVFLDVIDQYAVRLRPPVALEHVENHPRAGILVFQVGRVDEYQLFQAVCHVEMLQEHGRFVGRVFVEANLANAQHAGAVQELRDHRDHFARELNVFRLFGVDAEPRVVLQAVPAGAGRLEACKLLEVIAKSVNAAAIVTGPKGGLADRNAAHLGESLIVIRRAGDHVNVGINVVHREG